MESIIKVRPAKLSWPNKQWHLIHMFCGLLLDRNGIISYPCLLSQQLTYRKRNSVMEISRKQNWVGCIINGADYGAGSQPRVEKGKSERIIQSLSTILVDIQPFLWTAPSIHQLSSNFLSQANFTLLKITEDSQRASVYVGDTNLHLAVEVIFCNLLIHLKIIYV